MHWGCVGYVSQPLINLKPVSSPPQRIGQDNITSRLWSDASCPRTTAWKDEPGFRRSEVGNHKQRTFNRQQAILWQFCGNFRMSRGALRKLLRRSWWEKRTEQVFCTRSKKTVRKSILTLWTQDFVDFVSRGPGARLNLDLNFDDQESPCYYLGQNHAQVSGNWKIQLWGDAASCQNCVQANMNGAHKFPHINLYISTRQGTDHRP